MSQAHHNILVNSFPEELQNENQEGRYQAALLALVHVLLNVREALVGDPSDVLTWVATNREQAQEAYADAVTMLTVLQSDLKQTLEDTGEQDISINRTPEAALRMIRTILDIPFHEKVRDRWSDLVARLESKESTTRRDAQQEIGHMWADWVERRQEEAEDLKDKTSAWDAHRGEA